MVVRTGIRFVIRIGREGSAVLAYVKAHRAAVLYVALVELCFLPGLTGRFDNFVVGLVMFNLASYGGLLLLQEGGPKAPLEQRLEDAILRLVVRFLGLFGV